MIEVELKILFFSLINIGYLVILLSSRFFNNKLVLIAIKAYFQSMYLIIVGVKHVLYFSVQALIFY